ncbi:hypothetical protein C5167_017004 [Papaver somniferum]|uniref:Protein TIFY n=1 Tax=Papaver somniferum TaxID=3469 RepID=A0A4Y7IM99_PAPSO|nr:protein TIFY 4B-like isoform X1 [Papaver somniferum]RZC48578.1 hypothetical protein C5167_017004 [Papaver somniferum]
MKPGETTIIRSTLDKPLQQLTEDDISQLTREDCRRYLIQKGMRRPSWNKSQAIEQVISLKSLLETAFDDACSNNNTSVRPPSSIPISSPVQTQVPSTTASADFQVSSPNNNESVSHRRKDHGLSGDLSCRSPVSDNNTTPPLPLSRNMGAANELESQMTIFYSGKVNVYDEVSVEKARVIMQFAASPYHFLEDDLSAGTSVVPPCRLQAASTRPASAEISWQYGKEGTVSRGAEPEGPASRKASLQRYLEKRKDRGRFKVKKKLGGSSTSLEMYVNPQMKCQNPNEQLSPSGTCSPSRDGHM